MSTRRALISGYGIAGAAIAYWLTRAGWEVTVVERAEAVRSSGNPVDVRGEAVDAVRAMGCYEELRERATGVTAVEFVDRAGRRIGGFPMEPTDRTGGFEIWRQELAEGLSRAVTGARILWGESIVDVRQDARGVDATLSGGAQLRSDLLVAADGLHSAVRALVLAPEATAVSPLGLWIATLPCPVGEVDPHTVLVYNEPGRMASVHPAGGRPGAALMFRAGPSRHQDVHDPQHQKALVARAFKGSGWLVPSILEHLQRAGDVYFDEACQVQVRRWSKDRVVLLGDAASSVTIFGDGSSMAIVGARELARALGRHPDVGDALAAYEAAQRTRVAPRQRQVQLASHFLVPASAAGLRGRNALLRARGWFGRPRGRPRPALDGNGAGSSATNGRSARR